METATGKVDLSVCREGDECHWRGGHVAKFQGPNTSGPFVKSHPYRSGSEAYTREGRWAKDPRNEDPWDIVRVTRNGVQVTPAPVEAPLSPPAVEGAEGRMAEMQALNEEMGLYEDQGPNPLTKDATKPKAALNTADSNGHAQGCVAQGEPGAVITGPGKYLAELDNVITIVGAAGDGLWCGYYEHPNGGVVASIWHTNGEQYVTYFGINGRVTGPYVEPPPPPPTLADTVRDYIEDTGWLDQLVKNPKFAAMREALSRESAACR